MLFPSLNIRILNSYSCIEKERGSHMNMKVNERVKTISLVKNVRTGFSLVELMIVIVIIAVLGAAATNAIGKMMDRAKYSRADKDIEAIYTALINAYNVEGSFLADVNDGDFPDAFTDSTFLGYLQTFLSKELDSTNIVDPWGKPYKIAASYNANNEMGYLIIYVDPSSAAGDDLTGPVDFGSATTGGNVSISSVKRNKYVKLDPTQNISATNSKPMARLIFMN